MIEGNNLWNAVDLFIRAAKEIVSLEAELSQKMTERLKTVGGGIGFKSDKGDDEILDVGSV